MWRSYGLVGDGDSVVTSALGDGGAAWCSVALGWFCGERKSEHWRVRERAGVSGTEARSLQITGASTQRRGPVVG